MASALKTVAIFEKDVNGDIQPWAFPSLPHGKILERRCGLGAMEPNNLEGIQYDFHFSKFRNMWQYYATTPLVNASNKKVIAISIVVVATVFNPAKFMTMLKLFIELYSKECSVVPVMQAYLNIFTTGQTTGYTLADYNDKKAVISSVTPIFKALGPEAIAVWVAMLLKKRVFVYHNNLRALTEAVRSFPLMGTWHRQNWNLLRPYISSASAKDELKELEQAGVYVAGFTDPSCVDKTSYYDLFVDLSAGTVTVPKHARRAFNMTKFHKSTANAFVKASNSNLGEQPMIKAIAVQTKKLLDQIKSLVSQVEAEYITLEDLQGLGLPPNMDTFLFDVAQAEGLSK